MYIRVIYLENVERLQVILYVKRKRIIGCTHAEPVAEVDGFVRVFVAQEVSQILHDDVGVVISFHEPIKIVEVFFVNMVEGGLKRKKANSYVLLDFF